jgi:hypothetical protein
MTAKVWSAPVARLLGLGPVAAARYVHASRIHERVLPRVRARLLGAL